MTPQTNFLAGIDFTSTVSEEILKQAALRLQQGDVDTALQQTEMQAIGQDLAKVCAQGNWKPAELGAYIAHVYFMCTEQGLVPSGGVGGGTPTGETRQGGDITGRRF